MTAIEKGTRVEHKYTGSHGVVLYVDSLDPHWVFVLPDGAPGDTGGGLVLVDHLAVENEGTAEREAA